ncbi:hypothetical protein GW17_00000612 [Ensete ventricosum]|nr:hypothetical protein GW17_00000612 [Ensete ventricosum]
MFSFYSGASGATSIQNLLQNHGLPGGLLPNAVESFSHDPSSGLLDVRLVRPCYARFDDGLAYFESQVLGNLSYGALRGVVGWSQEELFLWLPVKGIVVADPASGVILFDIGVARKRLAVSAFEDPPDCIPAEDEAAAGIGELQKLKKEAILAGVSHINGTIRGLRFLFPFRIGMVAFTAAPLDFQPMHIYFLAFSVSLFKILHLQL